MADGDLAIKVTTDWTQPEQRIEQIKSQARAAILEIQKQVTSGSISKEEAEPLVAQVGAQTAAQLVPPAGVSDVVSGIANAAAREIGIALDRALARIQPRTPDGKFTAFPATANGNGNGSGARTPQEVASDRIDATKERASVQEKLNANDEYVKAVANLTRLEDQQAGMLAEQLRSPDNLAAQRVRKAQEDLLARSQADSFNNPGNLTAQAQRVAAEARLSAAQSRAQLTPENLQADADKRLAQVELDAAQTRARTTAEFVSASAEERLAKERLARAITLETQHRTTASDVTGDAAAKVNADRLNAAQRVEELRLSEKDIPNNAALANLNARRTQLEALAKENDLSSDPARSNQYNQNAAALAVATRRREATIRALTEEDLSKSEEFITATGEAAAAQKRRASLTKQAELAATTEADIQGRANTALLERANADRQRAAEARAAASNENGSLDLIIQRKAAEHELNTALRQRITAIREQGGADGVSAADVSGTRFQLLQQRFAAIRGGGQGGSNVQLPSEYQTLGQFIGTKASTAVGFALSGASIYGVVNTVKSLTQEAEGLQVEFGHVQTQLNAVGQGDHLNEVKQNILDVARESGLAATAVAQMQVQLQASFGVAQGSQDTKIAAQFARFSGVDPKQVVNDFTAIAKSSDAEDAAQGFEHISAAVIAMGDNFGVSKQEGLEFLGQIAPVADAAGLKLNDLVRIGGLAIQGAGKSGPALAEGLNRILPEIKKQGAPLIEFFDSIGRHDVAKTIAGELAQGQSGAVFKTLTEQMSSLNKEERNTIATMIGARRETQTILPVFDAASKGLANFNDNLIDNGRHSKENQAFQETLSASIKRLVESFKQLGVALLDSGIANAIAQIVGAFSLLIGLVSPVLGMFRSLNDLTRGGLSDLIGFGIALKAISVAIKEIQQIRDVGVLAVLTGGRLQGAKSLEKTAAAEAAGQGVLPGIGTAVAEGGGVALSSRIAHAGSWDLLPGIGEIAAGIGGTITGMMSKVGNAVSKLGGPFARFGTEAAVVEAGADGAAVSLGAVAGGLLGLGLAAGAAALAIYAAQLYFEKRKDVQGSEQRAKDRLSKQDYYTITQEKQQTGGGNFFDTADEFLFGGSTRQSLINRAQNSAAGQDINRLIQQNSISDKDLENITGSKAIGDANKRIQDAIAKLSQGKDAGDIGKRIKAYLDHLPQDVRDRLKAFKDGLDAATDPAKIDAFEEVQANYQAGQATPQEYEAAIRERLSSLAKLKDAKISDPDLAKQTADQIRKAQQDLSTLHVEQFLTPEILKVQLGQVSPEQAISNISGEEVLDPSLTLKDRKTYAQQVVQYYQQVQQQTAAMARSAKETADINAKGIDIDPTTAFNAGIGTHISETDAQKFQDAKAVAQENVATTQFFYQAKDTGVYDQAQILTDQRKAAQDQLGFAKGKYGSLKEEQAAQLQIDQIDRQKADLDRTRLDKQKQIARLNLGDDRPAILKDELNTLNGQLADAKRRNSVDEVNDLLLLIAAKQKEIAADDLKRVNDLRTQAAAATRDPVDDINARIANAYSTLVDANKRRDGDTAKTALGDITAGQQALEDYQRGTADALLNAAIAQDSGKGNALQAATTRVALARKHVEEAKDRGPQAMIQAAQELSDAQKAVSDAMSAIADAQEAVVEAMLAYAGNDVGVANAKLDRAKAKLQEFTSQGGDPTSNQGRQLQADIINATANARDTALQDQLGDIQFQLDMGKASVSQAAAMYQSILNNADALGLTKKERQDLELKIKQLKDSTANDLQFNLPSDIKLPTLYEVRRLRGTGGFNEAGGNGYQDNRQINIQFVNQNAQDYAGAINKFLDVLNQGSRYGTQPGLY